MQKYNHKQIEKKWQKYWLDHKTYKVEIDRAKPKYYVLDMFPYPSGSGLHVGHPEGYTATDILARYKRQKGFNVLHPMGWDNFGLPAEQYAIRTGTHPAVTTKKNVENFKRQLQSLGFSYDWDREISTSDPSYYKWTQWIFTKLYEKGLAYEAEMSVNFCPALGTVLANEEIENGRAKEGGHVVERRPLRQWVLKITAYAERLLQDLDLLDWPEGLKKLQANWIGRSEGVQVDFLIDGTDEKITVFTTCPHTLFGATYVVLAPEHPLIKQITTAAQKDAIEGYQKETASKSDFDRTEMAKNKTGVFTGAYAINPVNQQKIPIWIADYVLINYGTGAVMAVPSHDERDFEFATQYELPFVQVIDPELTAEDENHDQIQQAIACGKKCWTGNGKAINSQHNDFSINGLTTEQAKESVANWLESNQKGRKTISFKLRDWLFSRQRYWGEPFPLLHFEDGTIRTLDFDELPLCPPQISQYKPASDGSSPLANAPEWVFITDVKTGKAARRETNTMPQWAGSCWYYIRFCDPHNDVEAWSKEAEQYWLPVDLYVGGVEHAVLHLLYSRFWHKVLYDCGFLSTSEPFQTLRNQGLITARSFQNSLGAYVAPEDVQEKEGEYFHRETGEKLKSQIEKMSKSKLNGVSPDEIIEEFGADSLRLYEMFMGPLEKEKVWNTDAVSGCRRFLARFYDLAVSPKLTQETTVEALKLGHRLVKGVEEDIVAMQFNTAIAKMMEFINDFSKLDTYPASVLKMAAQALYPFAPHLAEEIWEILGIKESLSYTSYPQAEQCYLEDSTVLYVVQVNGKLRGRFELPKDQTEEQIVEAAKKDPGIQRHIAGTEIIKVIFVPNKLLNFVVRQ
ncbi:leucine--tRNA ligase [Parachlamydia acanthamoebae]|uniref:leucine--tRNA ligase n=1 Tax=Parachlamydia acanthamoebae TaxID=83552 RepID=UPI0007515CBA|nr:leucine--tRNA ligase [Parachlamydia acanthamoebae]